MTANFKIGKKTICLKCYFLRIEAKPKIAAPTVFCVMRRLRSEK